MMSMAIEIMPMNPTFTTIATTITMMKTTIISTTTTTSINNNDEDCKSHLQMELCLPRKQIITTLTIINAIATIITTIFTPSYNHVP